MSVTQQDLMLMELDELKKIAEMYNVKTAGQSRDQVLEAIQVAAIRKEEDLRQKVVEAKRAEALLKIGVDLKSSGKRPPAEDVAILASKKVIATFLNREDPGGTDEMGTDIVFLKGSFRFHLYDGRKHVLPECLVVENPDELPDVQEKVTNFFAALGMKKTKAEETAKGVMRRLSLPITCVNPVYAKKRLPSGETVPTIIRWVPRFMFRIESRDVPANVEFGPVESEVLHA